MDENALCASVGSVVQQAVLVIVVGVDVQDLAGTAMSTAIVEEPVVHREGNVLHVSLRRQVT